MELGSLKTDVVFTIRIKIAGEVGTWWGELFTRSFCWTEFSGYRLSANDAIDMHLPFVTAIYRLIIISSILVEDLLE